MGRLTTHVLDTAHGRPAVGMRVALYRTEDEPPTLVREAITNADGRCDDALVEGRALSAGRWRLVFGVGAYFAAQGALLPHPPFLDEVAIDFGIADPGAHYHVPLLVSPWSYSTYRGS
jgi:5-hydroxyisourate hydrolase